jgi:hypothetical protein
VPVACAVLLDPEAMPAAPVAARHAGGMVHGFLVLRTLAGDTLADGDLIQVARDDRVTSRLVFRFQYFLRCLLTRPFHSKPPRRGQ